MIRPPAGERTPEMLRSSVVLPAPFGPTMQAISPPSTQRSMPHNTRTSPYPALRASIARSDSAICFGSCDPASKLFAEIGFDHPLLPRNVAGNAVGNQLTMVQDEHAIGERKDHFHDVLNDENGDTAPGDAANERERAVNLAGIETGIDFIEHQQVRLHSEALRQLEPLACGKRKRRGGPVGKVAERRELELLACGCHGLAHARVPAAEERACCHILQHAHAREWLHDLEGTGAAP